MAVPVPSLSHRPYYLKVGKRGRKEGSEVSGRQRAGQTDFSLSYLALLALHGRRSRPIEVEVMNGGGGGPLPSVTSYNQIPISWPL